MILKLALKHQWIELYNFFFINYDPVVTLTFHGKVNLGCLCIWMGKSGKMSFNGRKLAWNEQMDRRFMLM